MNGLERQAAKTATDARVFACRETLEGAARHSYWFTRLASQKAQHGGKEVVHSNSSLPDEQVSIRSTLLAPFTEDGKYILSQKLGDSSSTFH